jgi:hypothetical protein
MNVRGNRRLLVMTMALGTIITLACLSAESAYVAAVGTLVSVYFAADGYAKSKYGQKPTPDDGK